MISFVNKGEIDLAFLSTFGANVKEVESPIGFFGTGLKYALALLVREEQVVTVWSGARRVRIVTQTQNLRGVDFDVVGMVTDDGAWTSLGFTTQLAKNWEMWMAYRELSCNTMDEKGTESRGRADPSPGHTVIWVEGEKFLAAYSERDDIILRDEPDSVSVVCTIRKRPNSHVYYRNVRAHQAGKPCLMTYSIMDSMTLTEDRTIKHEFLVHGRCAWAVAHSDDPEIVERALTAESGHFESDLEYANILSPSKTFMEVTERLVYSKVLNMNKSAVDLWVRRSGKIVMPELHEMTKVQKKALDRAIEFAKKIGFEVDKYPIYVVKNLGKDGLGMAVNKHIFVAVRAFEMGGSKQVAATLIEEFVHIDRGYSDCTYAMQNFLFERIVGLGEELLGEPL